MIFDKQASQIVRTVRIMRFLRIFRMIRHFVGLQSLFYTLLQVPLLAPQHGLSVYIALEVALTW